MPVASYGWPRRSVTDSSDCLSAFASNVIQNVVDCHSGSIANRPTSERLVDPALDVVETQAVRKAQRDIVQEPLLGSDYSLYRSRIRSARLIQVLFDLIGNRYKPPHVKRDADPALGRCNLLRLLLEPLEHAGLLCVSPHRRKVSPA